MYPTSMGEGWGEGLRPIVGAVTPHPDRKSDPTSPKGRGKIKLEPTLR